MPDGRLVAPALPFDVLAHIASFLEESPPSALAPLGSAAAVDRRPWSLLDFCRLMGYPEDDPPASHELRRTDQSSYFLLAAQRDLHSFGRVCRAWRAATVERTRTSFVAAANASVKRLTTLVVGRRGRKVLPPVLRPRKIVLIDTGDTRVRKGPLYAKLIEAAAPYLEEVELRLGIDNFGQGTGDPLGAPLRKALESAIGMRHFRLHRFAPIKHEHVLQFLEAWRNLETLEAPHTQLYRCKQEFIWAFNSHFLRRLRTLSIDISFLDDLDSFADLFLSYLANENTLSLRNLHFRGLPKELSPELITAFTDALRRVAPHLWTATFAVPDTGAELRQALRRGTKPIHYLSLIPHLTSLRSAHLDTEIFGEDLLLSPSSGLARLCAKSLRHLVLDAAHCRADLFCATEVKQESFVAFLEEVYQNKVELGMGRGLKTLAFNGKTGKVWSEESRKRMVEVAGQAGIELTLK